MEQWENKESRRIIKQMKHYLSVIRTEYAYALLKERDVQKAEKIRKRFEKNARSYPYPADAQSERELLDIADGRQDIQAGNIE